MFGDEMGISSSTRCSYGRSLVGTTPKKGVGAIRSRNFFVSVQCAKMEFCSIGQCFNNLMVKGFVTLSRVVGSFGGKTNV